MKRSSQWPIAHRAWIREELDWLFEAHHQDRYSPEVRSRWQKLWQGLITDGKAASVDIEDVSAILSRGWQLAMTDGDYERAVAILQPYFIHPQISQAKPLLWAMMRWSLAGCLLLSGDVPSARDIYLTLMDHPDRTISRFTLKNAQTYIH